MPQLLTAPLSIEEMRHMSDTDINNRIRVNISVPLREFNNDSFTELAYNLITGNDILDDDFILLEEIIYWLIGVDLEDGKENIVLEVSAAYVGDPARVGV